MERGDDTASAACTSILYRVCYDPPNEHTSEGGRDDRGVPYHAEPTLSSAQVLKSRFTRNTWTRPTNVCRVCRAPRHIAFSQGQCATCGAQRLLKYPPHHVLPLCVP